MYLDDHIRLTIANMTGHLSGDYSYCSDPPILADIGTIDFGYDNIELII